MGAEAPLADAAMADDTGVVRTLLGETDVNAVQERNFTALMFAAAEGHADVVRVLLESGADPSLATAKSTKPERRPAGGTPFLRAAWNGDIAVLRYLLAHGADPFIATEKGETALLLVAGAGWPLGQGYIRSDAEIEASLDLLVAELGMDVNAATEDGVAPLMAAVFKGTNGVVRYLVDAGARLDAYDDEGRTLLAWAKGVAANEGQPPRPQPESEKREAAPTGARG